MACLVEEEEFDYDQLTSSEDDKGMDECDASDAWYGRYLVIRVYDQLVESNEERKVAAWGANDAVIKDRIMKYAEGRRARMPKVQWTIPKTCENTRKKNAIMMKPVKAVPEMNYWVKTPVNIPTPDSKFLSHIPFLGDDHDKHDKNNVFNHKLFENYEWNFHSDQPFDDIHILSEVTISLVRVLMKVCVEYSEEIFSSEPNPSIKKPSHADLRKIVKEVLNANEKKFVQVKPPSPKIFDVVCEAFEGVEPSKLKARYVQLCRRRDPTFDSARNAPHNVDKGTDRKVRSKKTQMDSFSSLFCRMCFKYSCIQHVLLNNEEVSSMQEVAKLQRIENEKLLVKKPFIKNVPQDKTTSCTLQDCCQKRAADQSIDLCPQDLKKRWKELLSKSEWTPTDRTMFNCLHGAYEDYCIVASLLNNKTCVEVMNYHRLHQLMVENDLIFSHAQAVSKKMESASASPSSKLTASCHDSSALAFTPLIEEEQDNVAELYTFAPCSHKDGICDESCLCVSGKKFCETPCGCLKSCKNRFKGCVCTTTCDSKRCPCYCASRECDPDLCQRCGSHEMDTNKVTCKNVSIQRKLKSPIELKPSLVSGWGAFASTSLKKGDFIGEYTAELISDNEADRRGHIYDEKSHTYLFTLQENQLVLDAARLGSECRFINSSRKPNCQVRNTTVRGENHLAIVASKDIDKDTELFINYHQVLDHCKMKKKLKQMSKKKYIEKS